jgi:hypothetical protein
VLPEIRSIIEPRNGNTLTHGTRRISEPARGLLRAATLVLHRSVKPTPPPSRAEPADQILAEGEGYLFAAHHNVLITCWTAQGTGPLIATLGTALGAFIARHPEGVSNVHVIAAGLPLATNEARDALGVLMKLHGAQLACVGIVLEGTGFWASATRGLIVGLQLMVRNLFAIRTCATVSELVDWLPKEHAGRTGIALDPKQFARAIADARARSVAR